MYIHIQHIYPNIEEEGVGCITPKPSLMPVSAEALSLWTRPLLSTILKYISVGGTGRGIFILMSSDKPIRGPNGWVFSSFPTRDSFVHYGIQYSITNSQSTQLEFQKG